VGSAISGILYHQFQLPANLLRWHASSAAIYTKWRVVMAGNKARIKRVNNNTVNHNSIRVELFIGLYSRFLVAWLCRSP